MAIRWKCAHCDRTLSIGSRKSGVSVTCPRCFTDQTVPPLATEAVTVSVAVVGEIPVAASVPEAEALALDLAAPPFRRSPCELGDLNSPPTLCGERWVIGTASLVGLLLCSLAGAGIAWLLRPTESGRSVGQRALIPVVAQLPAAGPAATPAAVVATTRPPVLPSSERLQAPEPIGNARAKPAAVIAGSSKPTPDFSVAQQRGPEPIGAPERVPVCPADIAKAAEPVRPAIAKAREPAADVKCVACEGQGTSLTFAENSTEAFKQAAKTGKLVFLLHISGNFEDDKFT
jgi:hypothetical protein